MVGVKDEAVRAMRLQKHHAHRWLAIGIHGGDGHGFGVIDFARLRFGEPGIEGRKGVGVGDGHDRAALAACAS
jgi:hypothetical protein